MALRRNQVEIARFLKAAERELGRACLPFDCDSDVEAALRKNSARPRVVGLEGTPALRGISSSVEGHWMKFGMQRYEVRVVDGDGSSPHDGPPRQDGLSRREISVVRMYCPDSCDSLNPVEDVWAVPEADYRGLYRFLRRAVREETVYRAPLMRIEERQRLFENTIGFLKKGRAALERFGVPLKRGVMLLGEPGNGKTMAARWLESEAYQHGLQWRTVQAEDFDQMSCRAKAHELFALDEPGIVLFDDFDSGLRDRTDNGATRDHSTFLSNLDGVKLRSGIVYLFTSNLQPHELDPAARRPGRIDLFIEFPRPDVELRRQFFTDHWVAEARDQTPLDEAVRSTDGFSFAELDELKKLLVLRYLDTETWDWVWVRQEFARRNDAYRDQPRIGFAAATAPRIKRGHESKAQA